MVLKGVEIWAEIRLDGTNEKGSSTVWGGKAAKDCFLLSWLDYSICLPECCAASLQVPGLICMKLKYPPSSLKIKRCS